MSSKPNAEANEMQDECNDKLVCSLLNRSPRYDTSLDYAEAPLTFNTVEIIPVFNAEVCYGSHVFSAC